MNLLSIKGKESGQWRNIIERSGMSNNDEVVVITNEPFDPAKHLPLSLGGFYGPRLKVSRPIYQMEICFTPSAFITRFIDAVHILNKNIEFCFSK
jgi:hypothetical protein